MTKADLEWENEQLKAERDAARAALDNLRETSEKEANWAEAGRNIARFAIFLVGAAALYSVITFVMMLYDTNLTIHKFRGKDITIHTCVHEGVVEQCGVSVVYEEKK